ncbi:glycoside hydrolase family 17 protein [Amniculicola lignicola CBS 123094]|uniref:glucan endo-1,3-beta-D-glucosidase n=1 Tax=Amniculicola lignicola CBS 123094 TaxID=1392246 RepID=A0A6A5W035_9PLEO|nr:glycoside hydrolase family 17 protein [Amniculicola lignicola CBS 123094]
MNNANLHKVFPGMDYTPLNSQYPDCMHVPPSQNNVTRDMAVLSQMTNAVRLYGTDCNQTEMVLHAIDRLELKDMKVWLGVWLGNNDTTNERQLAQMWKILDKNDASKFKGVIIGNEVLFRKDLTELELLTVIADVKTNLTSKKIDLPVATSDLGDNWTKQMATKVDIVMSNVHPFFAGVEVGKAAGWTWDFWTNHDVVLTKTTDPDIKQIVAEVGWPSAGGNNCGAVNCTTETEGSVSGVEEMNMFMDSWICQSLANGTEYFW